MRFTTLPFIKSTVINSFVNGFNLLKDGHFMVFLNEFRKRLGSSSISLGLRRDLTKEFDQPEAKIPIQIREIEDGDFKKLTHNGTERWPKIIQDREQMLKSGLSTCYVAVTEEGDPCYMQWLIGSAQNRSIQSHFGSVFPQLEEDEALLEAAYMQPDYRGLRIMPAAMAKIAEKTTDIGARYAITFVDISNIPSLKGCRRSGFSPYVLRKDSWFLFRRSVTFEPVPEQIIKQYEESTGNRKNLTNEKLKKQLDRIHSDLVGTKSLILRMSGRISERAESNRKTG